MIDLVGAHATAEVVVVAEQLRRRVPGGIGRYAAGLLDGLRAAGAPAPQLLASRPPAAADPLAAWGYDVHTSFLPAPLLTRAWDRGVAAAPRGARVVHAVSLAFPPVRPARRAGGAALVVTVHDLAWRSHPEATTTRGRRWHEAALERALRRADAFVVPSAPVADELVAAGAAIDRVRVIVHGADHLPPPDAAGTAGLLGRLGVGGDYLLAAGTLEPRKNLDRLVSAAARARRTLRTRWPLVVVGPTGWGAVRAARPEERDDADVRFAGAVTDGVLAGLYAGARAFVYVPLAEGFGLPPVEAMACGVPVVASTAVPSVAPAPGTEAAALRVDARSVDAIAEGIRRAASDDTLRAELVARARALVRPMTWARAAAAHVAWWESLR